MSKKMPRLNNDEWNQTIAVCQQLLYRSTLVQMITKSPCSTYVTGVWLQQQLEDSMVFIHS